jgi:hypothetical protein
MFIRFRDWLDKKLVPAWRVWWKLWSMRLGVIAAGLMSYLTAVPGALQSAINSFPPWLKDSLPVWVGPLLLAVLFIARFWDQAHLTRLGIPQPAQHGEEPTDAEQ